MMPEATPRLRPEVVVYDANVLYPFQLRNLLVQCAVDGLVAARWTDAIQDEWVRALSRGPKAMPTGELQLVRDLMNRVLPDANVTGYEHRTDAILLPDLDDRHVVAAALKCGAALIVTSNLRDFPADVLEHHGLRATDPDAFLVALHAAMPDAMAEVTERARRNLRRSVPTRQEFMAALDRQGLKRFVAAVGS